MSNVDRSITELMALIDWPPRTFDVYNNVWLPGGFADGKHISESWLEGQRTWGG